MKTIKLFMLTLLIFLTALFTFNCSDVVTNPDQVNRIPVDGPKVNTIGYLLKEYVKVIPVSGEDPYFEERPLWSAGHSTFGEFGIYIPDTVTTPVSPRVENGDTVITQHFNYYYDIWYFNQNGNYGGFWYGPVIDYQYAMPPGDGSHSHDTTRTLSSNTTYYFSHGVSLIGE